MAGSYYESITNAIEKKLMPSQKIITLNIKNHKIYSMVYDEYGELVKLLGQNINFPMKRIIDIRNELKPK